MERANELKRSCFERRIFLFWLVAALIGLQFLSCRATAQLATTAAGASHTLVIRADGTVWAWGTGGNGQLGNNSRNSSLSPVQVNGLANVIAVAAGDNTSFALKSDGTVWVWGTYAGVLNLTPVQISGLPNVVAIAGGGTVGAAVGFDGSVWQLGASTPVQVAGISGAVGVAVGSGAGSTHYAVLKGDGTVWDWGTNIGGQLGNGTISLHTVTTPVQVSGLTGITSVAAGVMHTLALKNDNTVYVWGRGSAGSLGTGVDNDQLVPIQIPTLSNVVAISAGRYRSSVIKADGSVWCWGNYDTVSQNPVNPSDGSETPVQVPGLSNVSSIAQGEWHTAVTTSDGTVWMWGANKSSLVPLGRPNPTLNATPYQLFGVNGVKSVAAGAYHSLLSKADGTVWAWGNNSNGQLGSETALDSSALIQVSGISNAVSVAAGDFHSVVVTSDGYLWAWGSDSNCELGDSEGTDSWFPVQGLLSNVSSAAAGSYFTLALCKDGTVWSWGRDSEGELGDGMMNDYSIPNPIANLSDVLAISAGGYHSLALMSDGTVKAWGDNSSGEIGDGTTTQRTTPVQVINLTGVVAIRAGWDHCMALTSDGTVWTWGANYSGQLGNNSTVSSPVPIQVPSLANMIAIGVGESQSFALRRDGSVWAWGAGSNYLPSVAGAMTPSLVPVQISLPGGAAAIFGGAAHSIALKVDGTVETWGDATYGQSGTGDGSNQEVILPLFGFNLANTCGSASISSPTGDITISLGQTANVQLAVSGGDGMPSMAALYNYGMNIQETWGQPLAFSFQPQTWGDFPLKAVMVDSLGSYSTMTAPITVHVPYDSDGNGLPDWWELKYFGHFGNDPNADLSGDGMTNLEKSWYGFDPNDYFNGATPTFTVSGSGTVVAYPGAISGQSISALVLNAQGQPLVNAPVTFAVTAGGGLIASTGDANSVWGTTVTVRTDANGIAKIFVKSPTYAGLTQISATAGDAPPLEFKVWTVKPVKIAAGGYHTISTRSDGSVWTWGDNQYSELGDANENSRPTPGQVNGLAGVVAVGAGEYHSLAIKADGTAWAWGFNDNGQLGTGSQNPSSAPVQVSGIANVVAVAGGVEHSVALTSDGSVWTWGQNEFGQLGNHTNNASLTPVKAPGLTGVIAIAVGDSHSLALKSDGTVWSWGGNWSGQLGNSATADSSVPVQVNGLAGVSAIAAGGDHSVAVLSNGTVWAWGDNSYGELGNNTTTSSSIPVQVAGLQNAVAVAAGETHSLALGSDGTEWSWGYWGEFQRTNSSPRNVLAPVQVAGVPPGAEIIAGYNFSESLGVDNSVWGWGNNTFGELGNAPVTRSTLPVQILGMSGALAVSASGGHSLALAGDGSIWEWGASPAALGTSSTTPVAVPGVVNAIGMAAGASHSLAIAGDGSVWAWGYNGSGQLGNNSTVSSVEPVPVAGLTSISEVSATNHSLALKTDGTVWAWGANSNGQLGNNSTVNSVVPVQVTGFGTAAMVSAGGGHSLALASDGTVWAWGSNFRGQLGSGTIAESLIPVQVNGLTGVVAVSAGYLHSLALKSDGTVWVWGNGFSSTPTQVSGITAAVMIAGGYYHSLALKSDGTVWAWGDNSAGELGNNSTTSSPTPVQVNGLVGAVKIGAGDFYSAALKEDGTIVTWGDATYGQLGVGWGPIQAAADPIRGFNLQSTGPQAPLLTDPAPGTSKTFPMGQYGTLRFSVTAGDGAVSAVQLWTEGVLVQTATGAMTNINWQPTTWGDFSFTLVALDQNGVYSLRSAPVTVHVPYNPTSPTADLPLTWERANFGASGLTLQLPPGARAGLALGNSNGNPFGSVTGTPSPGGGNSVPTTDTDPLPLSVELYVMQDPAQQNPASVMLYWGGTGATSFTIKRSVSGGDWVSIGTTDGGVFQYPDSGVMANQRYRYQVIANNAGGAVSSNIAAYMIPLFKGIAVTKVSASLSKVGWREFTSPSTPPKFYLTESGSKTTDTSWVEGDSTSTASNTTSDYQQYTESYFPSYNGMSYSFSENSSSTGPGSSSDSYNYEEDGQETNATYANPSVSITGSYNTSGHGDGSATYAAGYTYDMTDLEGSPYSGFYGVSNQKGGSFSGGATVVDEDTGAWLGTDFFGNTITGPLWVPTSFGGDFDYFHGSISGTPGVTVSQTSKQLSYSQTTDNSTSTRTDTSSIKVMASVTLSDEYTTAELFNDLSQWIPPYPELAVQNGQLLLDTSYGLYGLQGGGDLRFSSNWIAQLYLAPDESQYGLTSAKYKIVLNSPAAQGSFQWNEVFVPYDPMQEIQVVGNRSVDAGAGTSDLHEVDPLASGVAGAYFLSPAASLVVTDAAGNADGLEKNNGVKLPIGSSLQFSVALTNIPDAVYTLTWDTATIKVIDPTTGAAIPSGYVIDSSVGNFLSEFTIVAAGAAAAGETATITMSAEADGESLGTDQFTVRLTGPLPDYTLPVDDASGPKYRKIGLNGRPMSDEKPQHTEESDQEKEESFVDAMTLTLRHSVTDAYAPIPGSDLVLSARRNLESTVWNMRNGLRPHERPDRPFGAGWVSSLAPTVELVYSPGQPYYAYVTDQNGSSHRFMGWVDETGTMKYVPMPSSKVENGDYLTSFDGTTFTTKFGTKVTYQNSGISLQIATDRETGSNQNEFHGFLRATSVVDRMGKAVNFTYGGTTLIPKTISVAGSADQTISIAHNAQGIVTDIWDPSGANTHFTYGTVEYHDNGKNYQETTLTQVRTADGAITQYGYALQPEPDLTPLQPGQVATGKLHLDLTTITDPLLQTYSFAYTPDRSKWNVDAIAGPYQQTGLPFNILNVTLPDQHIVSFANNSHLQLQYNGNTPSMTANSKRQTKVTDALGNVTTYDWGAGQVFMTNDLSAYFGNPVTVPKIVYYTQLTVNYSGLGTETYTFDLTAGLAVKSVQDLSGNTTTYTYGDPWTAPPEYTKVFSLAGFNGKYGDPTTQTNALGKSKSFSYDPTFRIMRQSVDELGRTTTNDVDGLGRRTGETVTDGGGQVLRHTTFTYGNGAFPGVVTQSVVQNIAGPGWAVDLVTQSVLDGDGRVARQTVNPGGLNLVTQSTYDASGSKLSSTDANGHATYFGYDQRHRLTGVSYPDGTGKAITYDARGNKASETDESGNFTQFGYDQMNRLTAQTRVMPNGQNLVTLYGYNAVGSRTSVTDPNGHMTSTAYDALQRPGSVTDAMGGVTSLIYGTNSGGNAFDSSGFKPTIVIDAAGYTTAIANDALYRTVSKTVTYDNHAGLGSTTSCLYDDVGNVLLSTDPLSHTTTNVYDGLNRLVHTAFADGTINAFGYTSTGLKWQVIDELGRETDTEYDGAGRAVTVRSPALANGTRAVTQTVYDAVGNTIAAIDPLGSRTDITYDVRNRKVRTAGPAAPDATTGGMTRPLTDYAYDGVGNVVTVTDPRNYITTSLYDAANRRIKVTAPAVPLAGHADYVSPATGSVYDNVGNVLQVIDPDGNTTVNTYDGLNRLLTTTDGAGITVTYQYDAVGNRTQVKDGKGNITQFAYDGLKRNTSITDALAHVTLFGYDALNKVTRTDANGQLTTYGYDLRNRLLTVAYGANAPPAPADRSYAYDNAGRLLTVTEPPLVGKADVAYSYDALNRVTSETAGGLTHQYTYDLVGNRLQTVYGGTGRILVSTYDALKRLQTVTESPTLNGGRLTQYAYDVSGNVVWKSLPNGDTVTTVYDGLSREMTIAGYSVTGNELYLYANGRDLVGNVTAIGEETANLPVRILANSYDGVNRLTSEQVAVNGQITTTAYTYDNANNRATRTITDANGATTANYSYDAGNRLTGYTEGANTATYGFDAAGSRTSWTENGALKASYGYDAEHRMTSLTQDGHAYAYAYDYRTRRVQRVEDGASTQVIFSGGTSVQEIENNATAVEYVRGSDWGGGVGGILYTLRGGAPSFTHYDGRGDVTAKTDGVGAVTYQASYQAFGTRTQEQGTTEDRQKANTKEEDPSGLLDEGMRYRDLVTGTFITADPAGFVDGPNLYCYVRQNPWSAFDPEGLSAAGWFAENVLNADTIKGGIELVKGADYRTAEGITEAGVGVVGTVFGTADAAFTVATCGVKGAIESFIKSSVKVIGRVLVEDAAKAELKSLEKAAMAEVKQLAETEGKQLGENGAKKIAETSEEAATKEIPKPRKGKGLVPPNERDPRRVYPIAEKAEKLEGVGGKCQQCKKELVIEDAKGHHIERHADGAPTSKENLAVVCEDCHKELHK